MYLSSHAEVVIKLVPIVNYYIYVNISKYIASTIYIKYIPRIYLLTICIPAYYM